MAKRVYTEEYIQAIADAIREKNKKTTKYKISEMAAAIQNDLGGGLSATDVNIQTVAYTSSNLGVN